MDCVFSVFNPGPDPGIRETLLPRETREVDTKLNTQLQTPSTNLNLRPTHLPMGNILPLLHSCLYIPLRFPQLLPPPRARIVWKRRQLSYIHHPRSRVNEIIHQTKILYERALNKKESLFKEASKGRDINKRQIQEERALSL